VGQPDLALEGAVGALLPVEGLRLLSF
jgi:hypothetical protein